MQAMDPSKVNSRECEHRAIDTEIGSLQESIHVLRYHRNALAPISSLPNEIIATIFFLLRSPDTVGQPDIHFVLRAAHVCHLWREIALGHPLLWSYINFTTVSATGATEILARAKTAPLYLEAKVTLNHWDDAQFLAFQKVLQVHISHIHHLRISAERFRLRTTLEGLISPAPSLEHLSLSVEKCPGSILFQVSIPDTLFDGITPRLSSLRLCHCHISWKSPLLKGLENLTLSACTRPSLADWLDALDDMPQLKRLVLDSASPITRFPFDVKRTVTLPSLMHLDISTSVWGCGVAFTHLVLPALTSLCVTASSVHLTTNEMQILPLVQHAHGPQDTQPLQSVSICGEITHIGILAFPSRTSPNIDIVESEAKLSARVALSFTSMFKNVLDHVRVFNAAVADLPLDNLVALAAPHNTQLNEQFWRHQAPRWCLLKHLHLAPLPARSFRDMLLRDDGGSECPVLPSLTNLELIDGALSARRTLLLCDALMKRVEQGVPLEVLDLRTCHATSIAVQLLGEIVADIWCPPELVTIEESMNITWAGATGPFVSDDDSEEEYYSIRSNLYLYA